MGQKAATQQQLEIQYVETTTVQPAAYNPRTISDAELEDLERSIQEFGLVDPIIVRRAGKQVIGGHQRLAAAQHLGLERVPIVYVDVSERKAKLLNLALNKISGDWDQQKLAELLTELDALPDLDLSIAGFDDDEIKAHLAALEAAELQSKEEHFDLEAAIAEARKSSRVRPGQLWRLGRHLLLCGDATSAADLDKLLAGDAAQLVVTDPPYNVGYDPARAPSGRTRRGRGRARVEAAGPIDNDQASPEAYQHFLTSAFSNLTRALHGGGAVYVFGGVSTFVPYSAAVEEAGLHLSSVIVWDKGSLVLTRKDYHSQYELIYYGWVADKRHRYYGGRSQTDIWTASRDPARDYQHPTQKPLELVERAIENSSRPGQTVLDPFLGSGTAIVACERTGRRCLAMEIDPRFCEVALRRWEAFTGSKARKVQ